MVVERQVVVERLVVVESRLSPPEIYKKESKIMLFEINMQNMDIHTYYMQFKGQVEYKVDKLGSESSKDKNGQLNASVCKL